MKRTIAALPMLIAALLPATPAQANPRPCHVHKHGRRVYSRCARSSDARSKEHRSEGQNGVDHRTIPRQEPKVAVRGDGPVGKPSGASISSPIQTEATWTGFAGRWPKCLQDGKVVTLQIGEPFQTCTSATVTATGSGPFTWTIMDGCKWDWAAIPVELERVLIDGSYHWITKPGVFPLLTPSPPLPAPDCSSGKVLYSGQSTTGTLGLFLEYGSGQTTFIPALAGTGSFTVPNSETNGGVILEVRYGDGAAAFVDLIGDGV